MYSLISVSLNTSATDCASTHIDRRYSKGRPEEASMIFRFMVYNTFKDEPNELVDSQRLYEGRFFEAPSHLQNVERIPLRLFYIPR